MNESLKEQDKRHEKERKVLQRECPHKRTTKWYKPNNGCYGIMDAYNLQKHCLDCMKIVKTMHYLSCPSAATDEAKRRKKK